MPNAARNFISKAYDVHCVDTTGAGDAFWGAILARLVKTSEPIETWLPEQISDLLDFANAAGVPGDDKKGAIPAMPDEVGVRECMSNFPRINKQGILKWIQISSSGAALMDHSKSYNDVLVQYAEYMEKARKILKPSCYVCKVCNGIAWAGRFTNTLEFGSKGNNIGFINPYKALADIRIELDVVHDDYNPDTSIELFGRNFDCRFSRPPLQRSLPITL